MRIDIHSHIFNADSAPLQGLTRRVPWPLSWMVGEVIAAFTHHEGPAPGADIAQWTRDRLSSKHGHDGTAPILQEADQIIAEHGGANIWEWIVLVTQEMALIAHSQETVNANVAGIDLTIALALDMEVAYREPGQVNIPYRQQLLNTLSICKNSGGKIKAFVCVHPRRKECFDLVQEFCQHPEFIGVKMYPGLGYLPLGNAAQPQPILAYDTILNQVYAFCETNKIPITAHCSPGGIQSDLPVSGKDYNDKQLTAYYANLSAPANWKPVLDQYKNLRLNLAHFGGTNYWSSKPQLEDAALLASLGLGLNPTNWRTDIITMMNNYPNLYADVAYHPVPTDQAKHQDYVNTLLDTLAKPFVPDRILFGTDMHLVRKECSQTDYLTWYETIFTTQNKPNLWDKMSSSNPQAFLDLAGQNK